MTDEMKPCPFCGGGAALQTSRLVRPVHKVMCESCGHQTGLCGADEYAILCWNTRPVEDELRAQIETMQANAADQMHCKMQSAFGQPCPKEVEIGELRAEVERFRAEAERLREALDTIRAEANENPIAAIADDALRAQVMELSEKR